MSDFKVVFSRHAQKDAKKSAKSNLKESAQKLIAVLEVDPFQNPSSFESQKKRPTYLPGVYGVKVKFK